MLSARKFSCVFVSWGVLLIDLNILGSIFHWKDKLLLEALKFLVWFFSGFKVQPGKAFSTSTLNRIIREYIPISTRVAFSRYAHVK